MGWEVRVRLALTQDAFGRDYFQFVRVKEWQRGSETEALEQEYTDIDAAIARVDEVLHDPRFLSSRELVHAGGVRARLIAIQRESLG